MTLDMLKNGETAVIKTVGGEGALRLRFLDMGLIPHTEVTLQKDRFQGRACTVCNGASELLYAVAEKRFPALVGKGP